MARGWESKSIEEQQAESRSESTAKKIRLTPEQAAVEKHKQSLMMSRSRVLQQMQNATSPAHRKMLEMALADLDRELARLG